MDTQIGGQSIEKTKAAISRGAKDLFDQDEFPDIKVDFAAEALEVNFESLNFKAINSGLGFHQEKKNLLKSPIRKSMASETVGSVRRRSAVPQMPAKNSVRPTTNAQNIAVSRSVKKAENESARTKLSVTPQNNKVAALHWQIMAWLVDMTLVTGLFVLTTFLFFLVSGTNFEYFSNFVIQRDFLALASVLFVIYYLIYFTILDLIGSPGKNLFGLRLIRNDGQRIQFQHTAVRAIVTVISSVVIFLPLLMDLQGKMTDTKIIR